MVPSQEDHVNFTSAAGRSTTVKLQVMDADQVLLFTCPAFTFKEEGGSDNLNDIINFNVSEKPSGPPARRVTICKPLLNFDKYRGGNAEKNPLASNTSVQKV